MDTCGFEIGTGLRPGGRLANVPYFLGGGSIGKGGSNEGSSTFWIIIIN